MNDRKPDFDLKTVKRLFGYVAKGNKARLALVIITILINTVSVIAGSMYLTILIDNYIAPMIGTPDASYSTLLYPISIMIGIYLIRNNHNTHII